MLAPRNSIRILFSTANIRGFTMGNVCSRFFQRCGKLVLLFKWSLSYGDMVECWNSEMSMLVLTLGFSSVKCNWKFKWIWSTYNNIMIITVWECLNIDTYYKNGRPMSDFFGCNSGALRTQQGGPLGWAKNVEHPFRKFCRNPFGKICRNKFEFFVKIPLDNFAGNRLNF